MGKQIKEHTIWSNRDLDYERDWKAELEAEHPELSEEERRELMYDLNNQYLDDDRANLSIYMDGPIIVIADLGLWNGRKSGYKMIQSGKISDCLYSDTDYARWYIDKLGDLRCTATHHDGTNCYLYRAFKSSYTEAQVELLQEKIYEGNFTRADITKYTERLGDAIANVYGFDIFRKKAS